MLPKHAMALRNLITSTVMIKPITGVRLPPSACADLVLVDAETIVGAVIEHPPRRAVAENGELACRWTSTNASDSHGGVL